MDSGPLRERPKCKCHGLPMLKNGGHYYKGHRYQSWVCRLLVQERTRAKREEGIKLGKCKRCGTRERAYGYAQCLRCLEQNRRASSNYQHSPRGRTIRAIGRIRA